MQNEKPFALPALAAPFAEFVAAYRAALAWSTSDWDDDPQGRKLESLEGFEFSPAALEKTGADCLAFFRENLELLGRAARHPGYSWGHAGHDLWLTRAGHGAGFWDGDLPDDIGDALTEAAKKAGEQWPYIGDDGRIHIV